MKVQNKSIGVNIDYVISFEGICNFISEQYHNNDSIRLKRWANNYFREVLCETCQGSRLKKEALQFKIDNKNINEIVNLEIKDLSKWFKKLNTKLSKKQKVISSEIIKEINERIKFLENVGLGYLTLNRTSKSLSGGESQRIRLASQIGSQLTGVLYILDEPSIGLHQSDNQKLIDSLLKLRDIGNSIIVVEHDRDMILKSDHIIDVGPYAGNQGGDIIFSGNKKELLSCNSLTPVSYTHLRAHET